MKCVVHSIRKLQSGKRKVGVKVGLGIRPVEKLGDPMRRDKLQLRLLHDILWLIGNRSYFQPIVLALDRKRPVQRA